MVVFRFHLPALRASAMKLRVGDFVRLSSDIIGPHRHLSLCDDRGIVVSLSDDGSVIKVVWSDGQSGSYPKKNLAYTDGKVGSAIGERRRPIRDTIRKPAPIPPRIAPSAIPSKATWAIMEERESKGLKIDPTPRRPDGGFIPFKVPHKILEVRSCDWPLGTPNIVLRRSENSLTVVFPNGEKQSYTPTGARTWIMGKFGPEMGDTLCVLLKVAS